VVCDIFLTGSSYGEETQIVLNCLIYCEMPRIDFDDDVDDFVIRVGSQRWNNCML
jgi:hypothetical protein